MPMCASISPFYVIVGTLYSICFHRSPDLQPTTIMTLGSSATLQEALTEEQIAACFPVIQTLRLHFTNEADFVSRVIQQQQEGYHLLYIAENGIAQALAGYRIREDIETPHPKCAHAPTSAANARIHALQ